MLIKPGVINYGASAGPDHYNLETFHAGLIEGGDITTVTSGVTTTLTAAQICKSKVIQWTCTDISIGTTTLPTSANLIADCFRNNGDTKTIEFWNTAPLAGSTTQIVAGTGMKLMMSENTGADVVINGTNTARMTFTRITTSTMHVLVEEMVDGD
ncbi:MAG: hypothetical protein PHW73_02260 [Atribacterota bacterium]|nr:hypothetical protein [Atribacterota bacterium]